MIDENCFRSILTECEYELAELSAALHMVGNEKLSDRLALLSSKVKQGKDAANKDVFAALNSTLHLK